MFGVIISAVVGAFSKVFSSGMDKLAKISSRLIFMLGFLGFVSMIIDMLLNRITSYSFTNVDPCVAHFMQIIGMFNSLGVFLQILALGLLSKYAIRYFSDSV